MINMEHFRQTLAKAQKTQPVAEGEQTGVFERLCKEVTKRPALDGITPIDMFGLPKPLNSGFDLIMRRGVLPLSEWAEVLTLQKTEAENLANMLVDKGYLMANMLTADSEPVYKIRFAMTRRRRVSGDIWNSLET